MKTVYIASPYTLGGKAENVNIQIDMAERLSANGFCPFWPLHMHFWDRQYSHDWQFWVNMCLVWVRQCDILLRLPGESVGADREVVLAMSLRKPIYFSIDALLEKEPND